MAPGERDLDNAADFFDPEAEAPFGEFWLMMATAFTSSSSFQFSDVATRQGTPIQFGRASARHAAPLQMDDEMSGQFVQVEVAKVYTHHIQIGGGLRGDTLDVDDYYWLNKTCGKATLLRFTEFPVRGVSRTRGVPEAKCGSISPSRACAFLDFVLLCFYQCTMVDEKPNQIIGGQF